jgi:hypothetical protein
MLLSPVRSGSTAFIHTVAQHPLIETATFLMKKNIFYNSYSTDIDYSIYNLLAEKPYLVYKTTFGYKTKLEATYKPFRSNEDVLSTKPLFMFREPVQTYNSWKKKAWGNIEIFVMSYIHTKELYDRAKDISNIIRCITYEHIGKCPKKLFKQVFDYWDFPYDPSILKWNTSLGEMTIQFYGDYNKQMKGRFCKDIKKGIYSSIINGCQTFHYVSNPIILDEGEIHQIESQLLDVYLEIQEKSWYYWNF